MLTLKKKEGSSALDPDGGEFEAYPKSVVSPLSLPQIEGKAFRRLVSVDPSNNTPSFAIKSLSEA